MLTGMILVAVNNIDLGQAYFVLFVPGNIWKLNILYNIAAAPAISTTAHGTLRSNFCYTGSHQQLHFYVGRHRSKFPYHQQESC